MLGCKDVVTSIKDAKDGMQLRFKASSGSQAINATVVILER